MSLMYFFTNQLFKLNLRYELCLVHIWPVKCLHSTYIARILSIFHIVLYKYEMILTLRLGAAYLWMKLRQIRRRKPAMIATLTILDGQQEHRKRTILMKPWLLALGP